jgi:hypothetical protein
MLRGGELCVCDIVDVLKASQPKVSRNLAYLRKAGVETGPKARAVDLLFALACEVPPLPVAAPKPRILYASGRAASPGYPEARAAKEKIRMLLKFLNGETTAERG